MICHCGVCVSSTKSLGFLIYFVLHFSASIFLSSLEVSTYFHGHLWISSLPVDIFVDKRFGK
jgi:hypothetical protein